MRKRMKDWMLELRSLSVEQLNELEESLLYSKGALEKIIEYSKYDDRRTKAGKQLSWVLEQLSLLKLEKVQALGDRH